MQGGVNAGFYSNSAINTLINLIGSSGINGTQIFACYHCDRVLGHRYLLWLKISAVLFLTLDPINFVIVYREPVNDSEAGILGIFNKMISRVCMGVLNYHVTVPEFFVPSYRIIHGFND